MRRQKLLRCRKTAESHESEPARNLEHRCHIRIPQGRSPSREASAMRGAVGVCAGGRVVLRVVDVDGLDGSTMKMIKYTAKG